MRIDRIGFSKYIRPLLTLLAVAAIFPAVAEAQNRRPADAEREARLRAESVAPFSRQSAGWVGVTVQSVDADHPDRGAVVVTEVYPDSPAERAELRVGDVIVRWNGQENVREATRNRPLRPGQTVRVRVRREGERDRELSIEAVERSDAVTLRRFGPGGEVVVFRPRELSAMVDDSIRIHLRGAAARMDSVHGHLQEVLRDSLEIHLRSAERGLREASTQFRRMEPELRAELRRLRSAEAPANFVFSFGGRSVAGAEFSEMNAGLASYFGTDEGVLVLKVAPDTPADRAGLRAGDVITEVGGRAVQDIADLRYAIGRNNGSEAELKILREKRERTLRMRWKQ